MTLLLLALLLVTLLPVALLSRPTCAPQMRHDDQIGCQTRTLCALSAAHVPVLSFALAATAVAAAAPAEATASAAALLIVAAVEAVTVPYLRYHHQLAWLAPGQPASLSPPLPPLQRRPRVLSHRALGLSAGSARHRVSQSQGKWRQRSPFATDRPRKCECCASPAARPTWVHRIQAEPAPHDLASVYE